MVAEGQQGKVGGGALLLKVGQSGRGWHMSWGHYSIPHWRACPLGREPHREGSQCQGGVETWGCCWETVLSVPVARWGPCRHCRCLLEFSEGYGFESKG